MSNSNVVDINSKRNDQHAELADEDLMAASRKGMIVDEVRTRLRELELSELSVDQLTTLRGALMQISRARFEAEDACVNRASEMYCPLGPDSLHVLAPEGHCVLCMWSAGCPF